MKFKHSVEWEISAESLLVLASVLDVVAAVLNLWG